MAETTTNVIMKGGITMAGMGLTQMNSLLTSVNTIKSISNLGAHRTALKGEMGVLGAEIEADKNRGIDTADKEQQYADMESKAETVIEKLSATASELNDRISEDNEKIREEESKKTSEAAKTEKAAGGSKSGEIKTDEASAEFNDTVEISAFAQNTAAFAPPAVPEIPITQDVQIGAVVDVKA